MPILHQAFPRNLLNRFYKSKFTGNIMSRKFAAPTTGEELPHSIGGHVTDADTLLRHKGLGEEAVYFLKEDARKFERLAKQLHSALKSGKVMNKDELKNEMAKRGIEVSEEGLEDLLRLKEHIRFNNPTGV